MSSDEHKTLDHKLNSGDVEWRAFVCVGMCGWVGVCVCQGGWVCVCVCARALKDDCNYCM